MTWGGVERGVGGALTANRCHCCFGCFKAIGGFQVTIFPLLLNVQAKNKRISGRNLPGNYYLLPY